MAWTHITPSYQRTQIPTVTTHKTSGIDGPHVAQEQGKECKKGTQCNHWRLAGLLGRRRVTTRCKVPGVDGSINTHQRTSRGLSWAGNVAADADMSVSGCEEIAS